MPEICHYCHCQITDSAVRYQNYPYHNECFSCWHCRTPLAGKTFQMRDNRKVCVDCYHIRYADKCDVCRGTLGGDTEYVKYEGKCYHNECFVCYRCRKPLSGLSFRLKNNRRMCTACAERH